MHRHSSLIIILLIVIASVISWGTEASNSKPQPATSAGPSPSPTSAATAAPNPMQHGQASTSMSGMSGGMTAEQMIKMKTTAKQRKAAAARAAKRRASGMRRPHAAAGTQNGGLAPLANSAAMTPDQLYFGTYPNYANSPLPFLDPVTGNVTGGLRKFVDPLPGIPAAIPDTVTFPGSDYYEIAVVQYSQKMHSDLPPTTLRGYVQLNNGTDATGNNSIAPGPIQYLGPLIIAQQNRPVRIKFVNLLPAGAGGNLFIPVDTTVMGSGNSMASGTPVPFTQNRATLHLHGGNTPWISDGTPHQWTVPAAETTSLAKGLSTANVPDMFFVNGSVVPQCTAAVNTACSGGTPDQLPPNATNDPGPGAMTFFYTNQQSARLMFYHDHSYGITRLNVYAGEAAGYLLQDPVENALVNGGVVPGTNLVAAAGTIPANQIPLVIQDKTFVPANPATGPVYSVAVLAPGQDYSPNPTVIIDSLGVCVTKPTATAIVGNMLDDFGALIPNAITGITLTNAGAGCSAPPDVSITDSLGTGAVAFASLATLAQQDPTWNSGTGNPDGVNGNGDLWFPHVYITNQWPDNPDGSGINPMGRWDYASWFWPPFQNVTYQARGPIPCRNTSNPTWMCPGFPSVLDPAPATDMMGGNSINSLTPEAFMDTPLVNGMAYPTITVEPKAYRFRILNAANDRTLNMSLFVACGTGGYTPSAAAMACPFPPASSGIQPGTEVGMVPSAPNMGLPVNWPTDGREGGVPDPAAAGPSWIVIGSEGGILPNPVTVPPTPIGFEYFRRSVTVLNVSSHGLMLMPAERADAIVDFSAYAGKTLILYNDAPAPVPAFDPRYDYYTGDPHQTAMGGAPSTLAGYGPNTRTIMQIVVSGGTQTPFDATPLQTALPAAFAVSQPAPVVPEAAYNKAFNSVFPNTYAHLQDTSLSFTPVGANAPVTIELNDKAIQELFELDYGRMNATLGTELKFTNFNNQTTIPFGYVDPSTEILKDSAGVSTQPVGVLGDGTQIWKITHNGVDSHAIHFHLFNVQLIDRVGWDGTTRTPDPTELGWKDTVRMNPLEITFVALRPMSQNLIWPIPDSIRPLDVTMPLGTTNATGGKFSAVDSFGNPITTRNEMKNFGWEYVWHCHILGHEENDMMRPIIFQVPPPAPGNLSISLNPFSTPLSVNLSWTDMAASTSQPGGGFNLQRDTDPAFGNPITLPAPVPVGFGSILTYADTAITQGVTYYYRVQAFSANGTSPWVVFAQPQPALTATTIVAPDITYGALGSVTVTVTSPQTTAVGNVTLSVDGGTPMVQSLLGAPGTSVFSLPGLTVGTHTLTANFPDIPNPMIVSSTATGSITVNPAPLSITASNATINYGDAVPVIVPTIVGLISPDTQAALGALTCDTTYTQGSPVGSYPTNCSGAVDPNYAITYTPGSITVNALAVSVTPNAAGKVYGAADPTLTGTLTGFLAADNVTAVYSRIAGETVAGGPYTISAVLGPAAVLGNYSVTYNTAAFTITPLAASVTPNPAGKTYGSADPILTGTVAGFLPADNVTPAFTRTPGESVAGGPYTISATLSPAGVLTNYTINYGTAAFTITPLAASVTPNPAGKTYGSADPILTGTVAGFLPADNVTTAFTRTPGESVAGSPYTISATLSPAGVLTNYTIAYGTAAFTISPLAASVTPNPATKIFGTADPALTGTLAGFLASDNVTATYNRTAGETVAGSPYTISATLSPAGVLANYTVTAGTAAFTITKATSATTITAHTPNPSAVNQAVAVSFSITPQFAGSPTGNVTVTANTGETCTGALAAGVGSCAITLVSPGSKTLVASYAGDGNFVGSVSAGVSQGVGGPVAFVTPNQLPFASQILNTTSATQTANLSNLGSATLTITSITVTGTNAADFLRSTNCTGTLRAGRSCAISMRFRPTAIGPRNAAVTILTNDPLNPTLTVALTGTGVAPVAALSALTPSPLVATRGTTAAGTVTLTETAGTAPLTITSVSIGGPNRTQFALTNGCPTTLPAGTSCTITITFQPPVNTAIGTKTATLTVRDNSNGVTGSTQTASLQGTAQ